MNWRRGQTFRADDACGFTRPTFGPLDAGVLVVAEEESFPAAALVAAHHVDADLLAAAVAFGALVHICRVKDTQTNEKKTTERASRSRRGDRGWNQTLNFPVDFFY